LYLIYVDDSGRSHRKSGSEYFCQSTIIVNERNWADIDTKIEELKRRYSINEIHTRDIDKMDKGFVYLLKNPILRQQILGDIFSLISQIEVVLISCIIDKPKYFNLYNDDDSKYANFTHLIERCEGCINSLCKNWESNNFEFGLMIMDDSPSDDDT